MTADETRAGFFFIQRFKYLSIQKFIQKFKNYSKMKKMYSLKTNFLRKLLAVMMIVGTMSFTALPAYAQMTREVSNIDGLNSAISNANAGDVIKLTADIVNPKPTYTSGNERPPRITITDKKITISGKDSNEIVHTIKGYEILVTGSGADVTFKDIVLDGNVDRTSGNTDDNFIDASNYASITFDAGTIIKNFKNGSYGVIRGGDGTNFTMKDGVEITNLASKFGVIRFDDQPTTPGCHFTMEGGLIHNCSTNGSEGVIFYVACNAILTISGGTIRDNTSTSSPGTVFLHPSNGSNKFVMLGGVIEDNTATTGGLVYNAGSKNTIIVGGSAKGTTNIGRNLSGPSNIYLSAGQTVQIDQEHPFSSGAMLGIYTNSTPSSSNDIKIATNARQGDQAHFISDKPGTAGVVYCDGSTDYDVNGGEVTTCHHSHDPIDNSPNTLWLSTAVAHTHSGWTYSVYPANVLTATCHETACPYTSGLSVTLLAENATYSGNPYTGASIGGKDLFTLVTTVSVGSIKYQGRSGTPYPEQTTPPTAIGYYTATVVIAGYTLTQDFAITNGTTLTPITVTFSGLEGLTYDGEPKEATARFNGLMDGDDLAPTLTYYQGDDVLGSAPIDAGTYTVTASMEPDNPNYDFIEDDGHPKSVQFTIAKAAYTGFEQSAWCTLDASQGSTVSLQLPSIPGNASYGTVANTNNFTVGDISTDGTVTLTTNAGGLPHNIEPITFTVTVNPDSNHNPYDITVTVEPKYPAEINGVCYLRNAAAGKWLGVDNLNNGMKASLVDKPQPILVTDNGGYTYLLDAYIASSEPAYGYFGTNGNDYLMNCAEGTAVSFWPVEGETNAYIIKDIEGHVFGYDGSGSLLSADATGGNAHWTLFTRDDLIGDLDKASLSSPEDATFLINDPQCGKDNRLFNEKWQGDKPAKAGSEKNAHASVGTPNGTVGKFNAYQDLGAVPNGIYELSVQGFYTSSPDKRCAYFYANSEAMALKNIASIAQQPATEEAASAAFTAGKYQCSTLRFVVTNHKIIIGVKGVYGDCGWTAFDNFRLTYFGQIGH